MKRLLILPDDTEHALGLGSLGFSQERPEHGYKGLRSLEPGDIQLVDFCAWALLRRENPLASKTKYGLDKAFSLVASACYLPAAKKDPEGIVRGKTPR